MSFTILNWNVGGAKFLDLPSGEPREWFPGMDLKCREEYSIALDNAIKRLFADYTPPDVVCLQEIVQYGESGDAAQCHDILGNIDGYTYFPFPLIDTLRFGATAKWENVKTRGGWNSGAFFSQGNGFLVSNKCQYHPMLSLSNGENNSPFSDLPSPGDARSGVERVDLHPGLYFGNRNSEPRAAFVLHIVRPKDPDKPTDKPLDIFVVNLHLTTLKGEREGIPDIDEKASQIRLNQLKVVLDNCISQYNEWRGNSYVFSDGKPPLLNETDTADRHNPVWILAGDFNFTPESAEYQYLTRRNFVDLLHHEATPMHHEPTKGVGLGKDPTITVDYVFAGPKHYSIDGQIDPKDISRNRVLFYEPVKISDHYPLLAEASRFFKKDI